MKSKMTQRMSHALGAFEHDTFYVILGTYFMMFVTNQVLAGADKTANAKMIATVTSLIVGVRLVEIIFDPLIGGIIDNARTKYGKFKPQLITDGVVSSVFLVTVFTNFFGLATHNTTLFIVLSAVVFVLLDSFYPFKDIAFWSMIPALSTETKEHEEFAVSVRLGSSLGVNGTTLIVIPIITFFIYLVTYKHIEGASSWSWFSMTAAVISGGTAIIITLGTKEVNVATRQQNEKARIRDVLKAVAQNDQLMRPAFVYIAYAIANVAATTILFYFFKYVPGQPTEFWTVDLVAALLGLVAALPFPMPTRVVSRRYVCLGGIAMMTPSYLSFTIAGSSLPIATIGLVLFCFPQQLIFLPTLMTITDSAEYDQWGNGICNEAVTLPIHPLLDKIAGTLPNRIAGSVAITSGMTGNATATDITARGVATFKAYTFYAPAALMAFSTIIFAQRVTLTEKKHAQIVEELENKLAPADIIEGEPHDAVVPPH